VESIGQPLVGISHLLPSTAGIQGFLMLNQMGATRAEVWPQVANLVFLAFLYVGVAWLAASWRARGREH
jgi:ABC-2 type transport system permease protein